jgi:hydroxypyruvate isomerase
MPGGDRGIISWPGRSDEVRANLEVVAEIAGRTGCRGFNTLYGQRRADSTSAAQDALALENLAYGARRFAEFGGTLYIEALARGANGAYPLETADDAARVVTRVREITGLDNIGLLFDSFHLTSNGEDLIAVIDRHIDLIAHVQVADAPGRGEPGSGDIDIPRVIEHLWRRGYRGRVAAEYAPSTPTTSESLSWVERTPKLSLAPRS